MRVRNMAAVGALAVGLAAGAGIAQASTSPVYSTSTRTEIIYNARCIHTHTRTVRDYSWSSKAGRYVKQSRPSVTVSDTYRCHS